VCPISSTIVIFRFAPASINSVTRQKTFCERFGAETRALAEFYKNHPRALPPELLKLADVQQALAHSDGLASWPRRVVACQMTDAIWRGDVPAVRRLVLRDPCRLHEPARGVRDSNWGPADVLSSQRRSGRDHRQAARPGAMEVQHAFDRACLQGKIETGRNLHAMGAHPGPGSMMGTCETLNHAGMSFLLERGAELTDAQGNKLAPVALILKTYSRSPNRKHPGLELAAEHGVELPDTAAMALHRGRVDLLEQHLR
jgi:hypothetical protein